MLKNNFILAWRNLTKNKLYTYINIGGLGLGMATAVMLILWIYNEFTFDDFHKKSKAIYRVTSHIKINENETWHWGLTPMLLPQELKNNFPEIIETTYLYTPWNDADVRIDNKLISVKKLLYVESNWFDIFDYEVINGSLVSLKNNKNAIAITRSKAKELFGESDPLDKLIQLDSLNLVIKVVLADYPPNTTFKYDVYVQNAARLTNSEALKNDQNWNSFNYQTFVVCNEKAELAGLSKKMTTMFRKLRDDKNESNKLELQALSAIHFDDSITQGELIAPIDKQVLYIFSGIAFLILLTACINYINLTTANLSLRNKEVSIKKFMGASKKGLFYQFFTESALTSFLAMLLAIALIYIGLPRLETLVEYKFNISKNILVWQILGGITLVTILFNGIYPSVLLANLKPLELIRGKSLLGTRKATFRKVLVVFQFAFTITLLICTTLIFNQLNFIQNKDLGYNKEQVFSISIPWYADQSGDKTALIYSQLQNESQLINITRSSGNIVDFSNNHSGSLDWDGREKDWNPTVSPMSVSDNYQAFFGLNIKSGRWFEPKNSSDDNHIILNETAVKEFQLKEPILGRKFTYQGRTGQIIAIVKDFHFKSPKEKISPLLLYRNNNRQSTISIKANAHNISGAIASVEKIWQANLPNMAFKYDFLSDTYAKLHESETKQLTMFYSFAGIVLLISCIGLFGLATFAAGARIKEIGIRKVLGASVIEIINLLSKEYLKLIAMATLMASPLAYWIMEKWLQNFANRIHITWWSFSIPGLLVAFVALLTVSYQSVKAALLNPVESLKRE